MSLLLEGGPSRDDEDARESCSSSDEHETCWRVISSANATRMLIVLEDSWRELSRRTDRDATEWSLLV